MDQISVLLNRYPQLSACADDIGAAYRLLEDTCAHDRQVLACGNGGSASDAAHIVGELMKSFERKRSIGAAARKLRETATAGEAEYLIDNLQGALRAISLTGEPALLSAFANDARPDLVYAQQVLGYGRAGDCLIAISTSGNSENVVHAAYVARALGLHTVGLTGENGGKLKALCDACVCVPETETYRVQELHLPVYHALCLMLEERFFG